jgi:hypothetical protein
MNFEFVLLPVTRIEYFALEIWLPLKILLLVLDPSTTVPRSPFSPSIVLVEKVLEDAPLGSRISLFRFPISN